MHNYRDIWDLVRLLCEEFEVEKNIYVYASLLYEVRKYTDEKKAFMYDLLEKLNSKMVSVFGNKKEKKISEEFSGKLLHGDWLRGSDYLAGRESRNLYKCY